MPALNAYKIGSGKLVDGTSMAASFNSTPLCAHGLLAVSFQLVSASGTRAGTVGLEQSLEDDPTNWVVLPFYNSSGALVTTVAASNGVALNSLIALQLLGQRWLRAVYTATSGAGNLYVTATGLRQRG